MYPVFLINLDRQSQRLRFMSEQLQRIGVSFERIAAVDGHDATNISAASYAPLTPSEVGCFESHIRFWKALVERQAPGGYVLEDDMVVASDLTEIRFPEEVLAQADIIKIDQSLPRESFYGTERIVVSDNRYVVRLLGTEMSTGCYFVTRHGAERLLRIAKNYFQPVDTFLFDRQAKSFVELRIWKLCEAAAAQMHMLKDINRLGAEFQERIQGMPRPEDVKSLAAAWARQRVRFRRLIDADVRQMRNARAQRYLSDFGKAETIMRQHVSFSSPSTAHYREHL